MTKQEYLAIEEGKASAELVKRYLAECEERGVIPAQVALSIHASRSHCKPL
jgi:hypothetical protein